MNLVYVAGPYSSNNRHQAVLNCREADYAAMNLLMLCGGEVYPVVPHNNTPPHWEGLAERDFWLRATTELMSRCDAVFVIDGWRSSQGTLGEIEVAKRLGMPVFFDRAKLLSWLKEGHAHG